MNVNVDARSQDRRAFDGELKVNLVKGRAGRLPGDTGASGQGIVHSLVNTRMLVVLTTPIIYSLIIPVVIVDAWASIYQAICFRVYRIPQVRRSQYMALDRASLPYLNLVERLNCAYCSYVNGVVAYVRELGSRTEQYWCPIKNAKNVFGVHPRYGKFAEYGDSERYKEQLNEMRIRLQDE